MKDILDQRVYMVRAFCAVILGVGRDKMATAIAILSRALVSGRDLPSPPSLPLGWDDLGFCWGVSG